MQVRKESRNPENVSKKDDRIWGRLSAAALLLTACSQGSFVVNGNSAATNTSAQPVPMASPLANAYESQAMAIIQSNCVRCHTATAPPAAGAPYNFTDLGNLVTAGLIVPGETAQSPIYVAMQSGAMPPSPNTAITSAELEVISNWIVAADPSAAPTPTPTPTPTPAPTATPIPQVSFATLETVIFQAHCTGCHNAGSMAGGYAFDSYAGVFAGVNTTTPTSSIIYTQIDSGAMPKNNSPLTAAQISSVLTWIQQGAKNN